ncbi:MAG: branched-chain amino acid ABC transporter substrate-binding protein, partial [Vulcanimicrobiaceae bacterium]
VIGSAGAAFAADKVIKIGSSLPTSGGETSQGLPTQQGALLAVEQYNAKGLPDGYKFEFDALDDAVQGVHNPAQGAQNMRTFIADPEVLGVVAAFNSNVAQAEIPITNSAGLVQVSPSNTNPSLTKGPDAAKLRTAGKPNNYFRVCTTDDKQGAAGATFARKFGYKKAFIVDDNETYGKGLADVFEASFKKDGGTVLGHEHVTKGQQDFKALLTKAQSLGPDLIYFGGVTETGGGLLRKQMGDVGMTKVGFGGGDGISDTEFIKIAGNMANGSFYTIAAPNVQKLPSAQKFIADYKKRFGTDVGPYSANAFAAAQVIMVGCEEALKKNGGKMPTRAEVLTNVQATNIETPIGKVGFDKNGDTTNGIISAFKIENEKPVFVDQISV